ncbi:hypothetical protein KO481_42055 [Nocardia sp. NEAU-G5]|uniref:PPE family domain-containing protein n=1 Tax=Nocardia albiluteola TaxID=2842303 RepID=A0ABS6BCR7_9NOCA|nr:hypothetical protein [Nocardia albiluteola]MBU3068088.1 hypothetical protein [Nocardia albiluteola]
MAPNPYVLDFTSWSGLTGSNDLMLESGTAEKCAQHVADLLDAVVGVHTWILGNYAQASPPISLTTSGANLSMVYQQKIALEMPQRLVQHRNILTDMGNTFISAGKLYDTTEHNNTTNFDSISFDAGSGTAPTGSPEPQTIPNYTTSFHAKHGTSYYPWTFGGPESGSQLAWGDFWRIGHSIDAQKVANAGGIWFWLSNQLGTGFTTLRERISAVSDQWTGQGAQAAIQATSQYVYASQQLTGDMNLLGKNLLFTSGWLAKTQATSTPPTPAPEMYAGGDPALIQQALSIMQSNFTTYYTDNFPTTSGSIVILPPPTIVAPAGDTNTNTNTPDTSDHNSNAGDNSNSNNSDTSTGDTNDTSNSGSSAGDGSTDHGGGNYDGSTGSNAGGNTGGSTYDPATGETNSTNTSPPLPETTKDLLTNPLGTTPSSGVIPPIVSLRSLGPTGGPGTLGGTGLGKGSGRGLIAAEEELEREESKLFPRSVLPPEEKLPRAGLLEEEGREPGFPIGSGRGSKDEEKERKRLDILDSTEHLDEAMGTLGRIVRPVLDR